MDLSRIQPVSTRTGFSKLAKAKVKEASASPFEQDVVTRLSQIMGREYSSGKMALTTADKTRTVPVVAVGANAMSGFHQGAGEFTMVNFLRIDPPDYSLLIIDEIETSLHPRAQRRLMRELAEMCRLRELQIIVTSHSPYVMSEVPAEARGYILKNGDDRQVVFGVSPDFAMTQMDDELHPECDVFVEDEMAEIWMRELLVKFAPELVKRVQILPFGAANVGQSLGIMVNAKRFPRPTVVYLDGDQAESSGCHLLPGGAAPERVIFANLKSEGWAGLSEKIGRPHEEVSKACNRAMTTPDHHDWVSEVTGDLVVSSGDIVWQAMCARWVAKFITAADAGKIINPIRLALP